MTRDTRLITGVIAVLVLAVLAGYLLSSRSQTPAAVQPTLATSSPTPPTTAPPSATTAAPSTARTALSTAEQAADALAAALQSSDFVALESLIVPTGFDWAKAGSGGLAPKTAQEAVQFLRAESGGRLQVSVMSRPIMASKVPWGPSAIGSTWQNFGNVPQQSIDIVLREIGGRWYWAGGYITS